MILKPSKSAIYIIQHDNTLVLIDLQHPQKQNTNGTQM